MHEVPSGEWTSQWSPWDEDGQSSSPKLRELKSEASATEGFCYIPDYIPTKALENFHCTIRGPCITRGVRKALPICRVHRCRTNLQTAFFSATTRFLFFAGHDLEWPKYL